MERTQIFLTREQKEFLAVMGKARALSMGDLIRTAVDEFMARQRQEYRLRVLDETFGTMPELPDGEEYTRGIREAWAKRTAERIADL